MTAPSLDAHYFDGIFDQDDDPWDLASSDYEAEKFERTCAALADRRYRSAFEIGCAHGVLTEKLVGLTDRLLAVDISAKALAKATARLGDRSGLTLRRMAFPQEVPDDGDFDLVVLSEVAYYWDAGDLDRASTWLNGSVASGGRVILVHYTGETDYPQTGDQAVAALWHGMQRHFMVAHEERHDRYRLDLWARI